ncbi:S9 family peptidase [Actinoplanes sp. NPDC051513]|uniref:S9 family peptidase n=1 Tax=Actinoplanes sp. NPDC051513 TaxID=3363908 RepID=UPI0037A1510B
MTVLPARWTSLLPPEAGGSWSPTLSPDGGHCAYVSDRSGRPQVWVQPVGSTRAFHVETGEPVTAVRWSSGGGWLACQVAPGGAPRHEVWLVRPDGSELHQVAGFGTDTAENMRWLPGRSLLALTENLTTAVLIDPVAAARTVVATGTLISLLDVSPDGQRALLRAGPRGERRILVRDLTTGAHAQVGTGADIPVAAGEQAVFGTDGRTVYVRSEAGEFPVLIRVTRAALPPLAAGAGGELLAAADDAEVEAFALSADGRVVAALWNVRGGESEVELIDLRGGRRRRLPLPGRVAAGLEWSFDGSALAFAAEGPGQPHGVWVHELSHAPEISDGRGEPVTRAVSATPAAAGAVRPTLETFSAHDGLPLSGWLYRPRGDGPHPAAIWLHGGPEAQERPGHEPLFQGLVERGIAVFAPNVRGSSGFGRSFVNADNGAKRYAAIEDVRSCVRHLVDSGISAKSRIGCMGRSYGGFLTLAALTRFPELFAVGVDVCGMSNFFTFYRDTEPWIAAAAISKYGDPDRDEKLLADLSPINHLDRLRAPLMIVHGENDTNVPIVEAEQLVAALAERGHPHRYLLFPGEGHDLLHRANRATYLRETIDWLATHIADGT